LFAHLFASAGFITASAIPTIPTDISDLTDTESLLGGGGSGDTLTNSTQTFSLNEDGNVVLSGDTGGTNRGLVWDYGAEVGGENSTVRQDNDGLSVRAWTEVLDNEEVYSAPVNIRTNQGDNEKWWRFGGDGNLELPDGGTIAEGIVTDNPTIELTPSNPSVESQKLVIKGGGGYYAEANGIWINLSNITFQTGDTVNAYIGSEIYAGQTLYWWIVPEESGISDPGFGTVTLDESGLGNFSFEVDNEDEFTVRVSQVENFYDPTNGVESLTINGDVADHHLHLTTGDLSETSIFLGTDDHNVRTTTDGKIQITTPNTTNKVWEFDTDGSMTFPDGSVQTTAFTGETISKYVAVNDSGVISGSVNGIDWNDYTSNLDNIGRVAVGPNKIVYTANSTADNDFESLWYADSYDTEPTEVSGMSEKDFSEVKYFKSISKFVAVGEGTNGPELHYSSDGVTWISSSIDPTYLTELDVAGENYFSDISENSAGFFILGNKAALGGFFLSDITDTMNADTHIDLSNVTDADLDEISWVDSGEFIGWHLFITGEGTAWYVNDATDPTTQQFTDFGLPIQGVLEDNIGVSSSTSEIVVGEYNGITTIMVATSSGQIVYWPAIPNGPFVSVPKPYTATISGWTSASPSVVTYTTEGGNSDGNQGGEKFVVSGSSVADYNGTYYLGEGNTVFTDDELTVPFDTTGLTAFTGTATITWSHGQYIDALHYSDGIFYAGNDTEEIFVSTNGGETWTQADQLLGGQGESDGYINDIDSYVSVGISANTGEFSFNSNTVTVADQDMQFRTTRAGFDVDADFDVESADDVHIDALGDTVGIAAANNVTITTGKSNMYPTVWEGGEENFIGTWNGTTVSLIVPSSDTTIITLLDHYVETDAPIWIRTASGYVETDTSDVATKTVDGNVTEYEIPVYATSPTADANIISMKLYDSITNFGEKEFEFTKDGKLTFPSGGKIEPVGMGWLGVTNGTSGNPVSILAKGYEGTERAAVTVYNSGTYGTAELYTVNAPGIVQTGNRNTTFSSGFWDANPKTALSTTGGSGTGLTVDVNEDGSGYADFVTIVNPGTGYVNGEAITVTSGSSNATFTIVVEEQYHNWTFDQNGVTTLPGAIQGRAKANTYTDTTIQLDVTATINKITPIAGVADHYHLVDGSEGQIMYITISTGGETESEDTCISFDHARWSNGFGIINENTDVGGWMPFRNSSGGSTILTLVFIDGHWNLPHNSFD